MNPRVFAIGPVLLALCGPVFAQDTGSASSQIDREMFFQSEPHDASNCDMQLAGDGTFRFPEKISSPAATCPDAMSWKAFFQAIQGKFWKNWAADRQVFPPKPLPMCGTEGADPKACCDPEATSNPGYDGDLTNLHCPFFPGDHQDYVARGVYPKASVGSGHGGFLLRLDPGRVIRQEMATVVFHNKAFFDYAFDNYLYSQNGLGRHFRDAQHANATIAPYRRRADRIEFPVDAHMFKSNWVHQDQMLALGLIKTEDANGNALNPPQDPEHPYITMMITEADDASAPERFHPGLHYLVGVTAATKDLPQWLWYAMEHVGNLGRCDFIGCNDSFGFTNPDAPDGTYGNFIPPHTKSDDLVTASEVFDLGKVYTSGEMTPSLAAIFDKLGIKDGPDADPNMPSVDDPAWRSYRLKGSQTMFTSDNGYQMRVGHSITEAGFTNTSSCMTCHTQSSVNADGAIAIPQLGNTLRLNIFGYQESPTGAPDLNWFYQFGGNTMIGHRIDYVWGIKFAQPELKPDEIPASLK